MYQIGVDIGGTNIKIGLVDDSLEILEQASIPFPHEGAQTVADRLAEAARGVLSAAGVKAAELQSIGVVIPGRTIGTISSGVSNVLAPSSSWYRKMLRTT